MAKPMYIIWIISVYIAGCSGKKDPKVLILGAGMSGITVAKTLDERGFKNFQVIEGSSRIGGRMKSVNISDQTVELGAMWVYGKGTNPIFKMLTDYKMSLVHEYTDTMTVRDKFGNNVTGIADEKQAQMEAGLEAMNAEAKKAREENLPDFTVMASLRYNGWLPETEIDDAIEVFNVDFEFGVPASYLSAKEAYRWAPFEEFGSEEMPILNDTQGYQSLVEKMARSYMTSDTDRLLLNKVVKSINQDDDGVTVQTADGDLYHGDHVVVTFSVGVLQHKEVSFFPPLPKCKQFAIDSYGLCPFTHVYLKFPRQFWDDTFYLVFASSQRARYTTFVNMNFIKPGSNMLQLSISNEESRRIERLDDQAFVDDIMQYIRSMYPNETVPDPTDFAHSRWTYDPLYHGAWGYVPASFTMENLKDMQAPYGRIFYSGEHLEPVQYGFVHGAYHSGQRTADELIKCLENPSACPGPVYDHDMCDKSNLENVSSTAAFHSKVLWIGDKVLFAFAIILSRHILYVRA